MIISVLEDRALMKLDVSTEWNYFDDQPMTALSSRNNSIGPPPFLMYSSITYDHSGNLHVEGGGQAIFNKSLNISTQQATPSVPVEQNSWALRTENGSWASERPRLNESNRAPIHTLYTQAPDQDLVFLFNGILSNGSDERVYPKMTIINTRTNDARTVSTETLSPSSALVGAVFQYLPLLGQKGALILFGGARRYNENVTTDTWGTMVPYVSRI
jgi:hypothetical protein